MVETDPTGDDGRSGDTPRAAAPRLVGVLLWSLFACLIFAGGWLFLRACGLDALGLDFCPARIDRSEFNRQAAIGKELARQVHVAQLAVTEVPVCASPAPAPAPVRTAPDPAPSRAESDRIDRTVIARGGQNGNLQFTLEWATPDDLDLNVDCPGGRIDSRPGHDGPGICGDGRKDIDANRNLTQNLSATPIENVVWQSDVPQGTYRIEVIEFKASTAAGNSVPFTLRIRWRGQERICRGLVSTLPESVQQPTGDGKLAGGTEQLLTWTLGDALPACEFEAAQTIRSAVPLK